MKRKKDNRLSLRNFGLSVILILMIAQHIPSVAASCPAGQGWNGSA